MIKTCAVDRTQEKLALAKELGLDQYVYQREQEANERDVLTSLSFKPITDEEIEKMLCKRVFRLGFAANEGTAIASILFIMSSCFGIPLSIWVKGAAATFIPVLAVGLIIFTIAWLAVSFPKTEIKRNNLKHWNANMPYGALLAVKEAKAKGLINFMIHYPVLQDRRVLADPVITANAAGIDKNLMIFAWDDGKVYE